MALRTIGLFLLAGSFAAVGLFASSLSANQIESLHGILNGTCNYILSQMESTGADFGDVLNHFSGDANVRAIVLYVEHITAARKFMSAARSFARVKPIIVIKSGRFKEGAKAASSHTGAMAGEDYIYDAAFKRAGCVRVKHISELFNCASILAKQPRPTGPLVWIGLIFWFAYGPC